MTEIEPIKAVFSVAICSLPMIKIDDGDAGSLVLNQEYYLPTWFYPQVA